MSEVLPGFARLVIAARAAHGALGRSQAPDTLAMRRAVHGMERALAGREPELLALVLRAPHPSAEPAWHAATVCALALLAGRRAGMPRGPLAELGMASLLHEGVLEPARHALLVAADPSPAAVGWAATAVEARLAPGEASAGARLVAVCCALDRLRAPPAPRRGLAPAAALGLLASKTARFDPAAVALLAAATSPR